MSSHSDAKTIVALVPHNLSINQMKMKEKGQKQWHCLAPSEVPPGACSLHCKAPPPGGKTGQNGHRQAVHNRPAKNCSELV